MLGVKKLTIFVVLVVLTILIQIIPAISSHKYVLLTLFSSLPLFLIARSSGPLGLIAFVIAGISIFSINSHEGLFFLFTNGPVGLMLGLQRCFKKESLTASFITGLILTITLSLLNFIIGIKVFGTEIPGPLVIQILLIFLFSFLYSTMYSYFAGFIYRRLRKKIILKALVLKQ
jgi:hypothetical protein